MVEQKLDTNIRFFDRIYNFFVSNSSRVRGYCCVCGRPVLMLNHVLESMVCVFIVMKLHQK